MGIHIIGYPLLDGYGLVDRRRSNTCRIVNKLRTIGKGSTTCGFSNGGSEGNGLIVGVTHVLLLACQESPCFV